MSLDEQWSYCVVGGIKEACQSEESGQVQLRQDTVKMMQVEWNNGGLNVKEGGREEEGEGGRREEGGRERVEKKKTER